MKPMVTAVVVAHDAAEYLEETLRALSAQTTKPDRVIIVNTGVDSPSAIPESFEVISLPPSTTLDSSLRQATSDLDTNENSWLWILHDDSAPEAQCLEHLLDSVERFGLVGAVAPKQMRWNQPRVIHQLGLTLTPLGTPISLVSGELDQSQHDSESDVLAAGTSGLLVRTDLWKKVGGLSDAPPLAADYDLCVRLRLEGARVVVAPTARIRHAALSMNGQRERRWLRGKTKLALRKAAIHIRLAYEPLWVAIPFWFFLPLITIANVVWRLFQKRPDRIGAEIAAGIWGYFTIIARLRSRTGQSSKIRAIRKAFDASWAQVRVANRFRLEDEESRELGPEAVFEQQPAVKSFAGAGGLAFLFLLLALGYQYFPQGVAAVGGGSIPLGTNWWAVFSRTGVFVQDAGMHAAVPSDPFNWVLLFLSTFSPSAPSTAVVWFIFLAAPLSFFGAWRALGLMTNKAWARNLGALVYALWPALWQQIGEARLQSLVASVALPWLALAIARAAGLGRSGSARSMRQTWSWVGLAALLMAVVGASSPILCVPMLIALAGVALTRIRRLVYLFWIPLPLATLFAPFVIFLAVDLQQPAAVLADPGLPAASSASPLASWIPNFEQPLTYAPLVLVVLSAAALLTKRWVLALVIWIFGLLTVLISVLHANSVYFQIGMNQELVPGSISTLSCAVALLLAGLVALLFEQSNQWGGRVLAIVTALGLVIPLAAGAALTQRSFDFKDDRVVPWLLEAASQEDSVSTLLTLKTSNGNLYATLGPTAGLRFENQSVGYRFLVSNTNSDDPFFNSVAELAASLRSGASKGVTEKLSTNKVGYVLVPNGNLGVSSELISALDGSSALESAGLTEFGKLWRVKDATSLSRSEPRWWSKTKGTQLAILIGFLLLAIPTATRRRKVSERDFQEIDGEES